tara:strand:- start:145 stop:606 length:462 start_codon:yes stop_codon:yes gene_type:complete
MINQFNFLMNDRLNIAVIVICIIILIYIFYFNSSKAVLNANIEDIVNKEQIKEGLEVTDPTNKNQIILYYASWCGWSQKIIPEWNKFKEFIKTNRPDIHIDDILCEGENENICKTADLKGYPTIIFKHKNGETEKYENERTNEELQKWVMSKM